MFNTFKFLVGRRFIWDKKQEEILYIVDDPADAYSVYYTGKAGEKKDPISSILYEWYINDSFNKDALEFCKQKYDSISTMTIPGPQG